MWSSGTTCTPALHLPLRLPNGTTSKMERSLRCAPCSTLAHLSAAADRGDLRQRRPSGLGPEIGAWTGPAALRSEAPLRLRLSSGGGAEREGLPTSAAGLPSKTPRAEMHWSPPACAWLRWTIVHRRGASTRYVQPAIRACWINCMVCDRPCERPQRHDSRHVLRRQARGTDRQR